MCYLVHRSGAEMFTRDLALWLRRRGHAVTVFATAFGDMADELRHASVACITHPSQSAARPDIVIGNTHDELVRALLQFPDVPALPICHDRSADHGRPPALSQVVRHIAVDENCAERLVHEFGIAREDVALLQNGVDLDRFKARGPLPEVPRRALVFSNYATHNAQTDEIRKACAAAGLSLDVVGEQAGNQAAEPADILGTYDIVFGKARCATEALATGCAVIVLDPSQGMGSLVTSDNIAHARLWNFGRRLTVSPITQEGVLHELRRYRREDVQQTARWARAHFGLDTMGLAIEAHVHEALAMQPRIAVDAGQRLTELAHYIDDWIARGRPAAAHADLARMQLHHQQMHQSLQHHLRQHEIERDHLHNQLQQQESHHTEALHQRTLAQAGQHAEALAQALTHARAELQREADAHTQRARTEAAEATAHAIYQSRSWRLTRPLRAVAEALKPLARPFRRP